jgi:hypothetical protein
VSISPQKVKASVKIQAAETFQIRALPVAVALRGFYWESLTTSNWKVKVITTTITGVDVTGPAQAIATIRNAESNGQVPGQVLVELSENDLREQEKTIPLSESNFILPPDVKVLNPNQQSVKISITDKSK